MSWAKHKNLIITVLIVIACVCVMAACVVAPMSSAKYVVVAEVTSDIVIYEDTDMEAMSTIETLEELLKLFNDHSSQMYAYWVNSDYISKNNSVLDGLGSSYGIHVTQEVKDAYAAAHEGKVLKGFGYCIINDLTNHKFSFYFTPQDIAFVPQGTLIEVDKVTINYTYTKGATEPFVFAHSGVIDITGTAQVTSKTMSGKTFNIIDTASFTA